MEDRKRETKKGAAINKDWKGKAKGVIDSLRSKGLSDTGIMEVCVKKFLDSDKRKEEK